MSLCKDIKILYEFILKNCIMDLIYTKKCSLNEETCKSVIDFFESHKMDCYDGFMKSLNVDKSIKDTTEFNISLNVKKYPELKALDDLLYSELTKNIKLYYSRLHPTFTFNMETIDLGYQIQKYLKGQGKYTYHNDFDINFDKRMFRTLTYIWYLNAIEEGGETEFFGGNIKIKPECGKLAIFPCSWCYPHAGLMPISSDKYIITGWIYCVVPSQ